MAWCVGCFIDLSCCVCGLCPLSCPGLSATARGWGGGEGLGKVGGTVIPFPFIRVALGVREGG